MLSLRAWFSVGSEMVKFCRRVPRARFAVLSANERHPRVFLSGAGIRFYLT
jgi:hypothetical protein